MTKSIRTFVGLTLVQAKLIAGAAALLAGLVIVGWEIFALEPRPPLVILGFFAIVVGMIAISDEMDDRWGSR